MIKKVLRSILQKAGFKITRLEQQRQFFHYNDNMKAGLERFSKLGIQINTIVDVGAAEGAWSLSAKQFWPNASFLMFEPLRERKAQLMSLSQANTGFHFVSSAAGKEIGKVHFAVAEDLDGSGIAATATEGNIRTVDVTSIQIELDKRELKGPFIIKLDTHGFEVPIIEGCSNVLKDVSLFIIESYGFRLTPQSFLFWEMCQYMDSLGFRLFDIVDTMHRKKDGAFWQCDAFFIKNSHPLFQDNRYV